MAKIIPVSKHLASTHPSSSSSSFFVKQNFGKILHLCFNCGNYKCSVCFSSPLIKCFSMRSLQSIFLVSWPLDYIPMVPLRHQNKTTPTKNLLFRSFSQFGAVQKVQIFLVIRFLGLCILLHYLHFPFDTLNKVQESMSSLFH